MTTRGSEVAKDWVAANSVRFPHAPALENADTGEQWSWSQLEERVARLAGALAESCEVKRGDRVVVLSEGDTRNLEIQFALMRLGAILVPLNWRLAEAELLALTEDVEPDVVIFDEAWQDTATRLAESVGARYLIGWRCSAPLDYDTLLDKGSPFRAGTQNRLDDPTHVLHTSGTTGLPKGALVTAGTMAWQTLNILYAHRLRGPGTKQLNPLPMFHAGGLTTNCNPLLMTGGCVSVMRRFDPERVAQLLCDPAAGVTHWVAPPVMHQAVVGMPGFASADLSHLELVLVAGGVPPLSLLESFQEHGAVMQQSYGGTELGPAVTIMPREAVAERPVSCGVPVPFTHVRVVNPDGDPAAVDEVGEVWIKGPSVTPGYWRIAQDDYDGFQDGWFLTGDAARVDEAGFFYLVDRYKDMYKSGAENVYPAEVERVLATHPAVAEVAIIGIPDERWGQVGRAFVVTQPGAEVTLEELLEHGQAQLARYKLPKVLTVLESLPRNTTGKVQKQQLKADYSVTGL